MRISFIPLQKIVRICSCHVPAHACDTSMCFAVVKGPEALPEILRFQILVWALLWGQKDVATLMLPAEGWLQAQFLRHTEIVPRQLGEVVQAQNRPHCAIAQEEFLGATHLCRDIRNSNSRRTNWQRLFEPYDFFKGFKNYLQVWRLQK